MTNPQSNIFQNNQYLLGFSYFLKIGPITMRKIEQSFSNLQTAFWANSLELEKAGLSQKLSTDFIKWRKNFSFNRALEELTKEKIKFLTWHDENYPKLLLEIPAPPFILYYRGNFGKQTTNRLAVVGSRHHSAYAEKIITELLPQVIKNGIEIISGLAKGVDTLAHCITLNNQGVTLAVLGSGLSRKNIYPVINKLLAENIIKNGGAIISEFPPSIPPLKQNFPQRNRIISGLARATLIIEAQAKSGALITANYSLEQNREVLAVPGNIFSSYSDGPNNLIKLGAKVIGNFEDILEVFNIQTNINTKKIKHIGGQCRHVTNFIPENNNEKIIYQILKSAAERAEVISTDEIIKLSKQTNQLDTATINSTLSMLEIRGVAKNEGIGYSLN